MFYACGLILLFAVVCVCFMVVWFDFCCLFVCVLFGFGLYGVDCGFVFGGDCLGGVWVVWCWGELLSGFGGFVLVCFVVFALWAGVFLWGGLGCVLLAVWLFCVVLALWCVVLLLGCFIVCLGV